MKDIKDVRDPRDMNTNDVIDLLDEMRAIAMRRGTELLAQGRRQARRAIGAPDEGAVSTAFVLGIVLGGVVAAVVTLLMSPVPAPEARRRLTEQVEKVRERVPAPRSGNGRPAYERVTESAEVESASGSIANPSA